MSDNRHSRGGATTTPVGLGLTNQIIDWKRDPGERGVSPVRLDWSYNDTDLKLRGAADNTLDIRTLHLYVKWGIGDNCGDSGYSSHEMTLDCLRGGSVILAANKVTVHVGYSTTALPAGLTYPKVEMRVSIGDASGIGEASHTAFIGSVVASVETAKFAIPARATALSIQNENSIVTSGIVTQYALNQSSIISSEQVSKGETVPVRQGAMYFTLTLPTTVTTAAAQFKISA